MHVSDSRVRIRGAAPALAAKDGIGKIIGELGGRNAVVAVSVSQMSDPFTPDFVVHVNPVISRSGCNAGTCHGAKDGKNGFKLSLRGYDAIADVIRERWGPGGPLTSPWVD